MPYNTRRKSLSLPSLGIHLPNSSRSHRSPSLSKPPATTATTTTTSTSTTSHSIPTPTSASSSTTMTTVATTTDFLPPPSKKVKRSHDSISPPSSSHGKTRSNGSRPSSRRGAGPYEHTPPPSPLGTGETAKIDTEGINDDIVVAVIEQLEKTGNRPHLIKELAAIMSTTNETVANSANPAALLSSRLSLYLKRPWSALAPCPLAKELIPVHPRRVFFYLTTSPHQPLPENSDDIIAPAAQITPSVSSASVNQDEEDEDALARERAQLSPSPEVDLSTPEFDEDEAQIDDDLNGRNGSVRPPTPTGSFSARSSLGPHEHSHNHGPYPLSHNHRAISPPLEGDEKEFTQTASSVRERTSSSEDLSTRHLKNVDDGMDLAVDERTGSGSFASSMDGDDQTQSTEDTAHTQDAGFHDDYLSSNPLHDHYQSRGLETTTASALFGTRSPSPLSDSASLTPLTTATSNAELDSEDPSNAVDVDKVSDMLQQTQQNQTALSIETSSPVPSVLGSKRSIDMVETESTTSTIDSNDSSVDPEGVPMRMPLGMSATFDISVGSCGNPIPSGDVDKTVVIRSESEMDLSMESWSDLRSPETVEVGELDAFFADI